MDSKEIAQNIYYMTEDNIHNILEDFKKNNATDQSLIHCYLKAYYLHIIKYYKNIDHFEDIYNEYKNKLKEYYRFNNPLIEDVLLDQILNFFDNSFELINTITISDIEDSYEFRHYTINIFELLRMILEKKSNSIIRENIFDKYIKNIIIEADNIKDFIKNKKE